MWLTKKERKEMNSHLLSLYENDVVKTILVSNLTRYYFYQFYYRKKWISLIKEDKIKITNTVSDNVYIVVFKKNQDDNSNSN